MTDYEFLRRLMNAEMKTPLPRPPPPSLTVDMLQRAFYEVAQMSGFPVRKILLGDFKPSRVPDTLREMVEGK